MTSAAATAPHRPHCPLQEAGDRAAAAGQWGLAIQRWDAALAASPAEPHKLHEAKAQARGWRERMLPARSIGRQQGLLWVSGSNPLSPLLAPLQVWLEVGEDWKAVQAARRAVELAPHWAEGHLTLSRAQVRPGEVPCPPATAVPWATPHCMPQARRQPAQGCCQPQSCRLPSPPVACAAEPGGAGAGAAEHGCRAAAEPGAPRGRGRSGGDPAPGAAAARRRQRPSPAGAGGARQRRLALRRAPWQCCCVLRRCRKRAKWGRRSRACTPGRALQRNLKSRVAPALGTTRPAWGPRLPCPAPRPSLPVHCKRIAPISARFAAGGAPAVYWAWQQEGAPHAAALTVRHRRRAGWATAAPARHSRRAYCCAACALRPAAAAGTAAAGAVSASAAPPCLHLQTSWMGTCWSAPECDLTSPMVTACLLLPPSTSRSAAGSAVRAHAAATPSLRPVQDLSGVPREHLRRVCEWHGLPARGTRAQLEDCIAAAIARGARVSVDDPAADTFREGVILRTLPPW